MAALAILIYRSIRCLSRHDAKQDNTEKTLAKAHDYYEMGEKNLLGKNHRDAFLNYRNSKDVYIKLINLEEIPAALKDAAIANIQYLGQKEEECRVRQ